LGCTELPLLFNKKELIHPVFIPQDILAEEAVIKAMEYEAVDFDSAGSE